MLKCIICNNLATELAHSKLKTVYLVDLLVVMTVALKIVRILARNVPRTRTQALRRQRVSRVSLSLQESNSVVFSMCWGHCPVENIKKSSQDNLHMSHSDF